MNEGDEHGLIHGREGPKGEKPAKHFEIFGFGEVKSLSPSESVDGRAVPRRNAQAPEARGIAAAGSPGGEHHSQRVVEQQRRFAQPELLLEKLEQAGRGFETSTQAGKGREDFLCPLFDRSQPGFLRGEYRPLRRRRLGARRLVNCRG